MKPSVLVVIILVFTMAFVSRAIGTVGDVRQQLAMAEDAAASDGAHGKKKHADKDHKKEKDHAEKGEGGDGAHKKDKHADKKKSKDHDMHGASAEKHAANDHAPAHHDDAGHSKGAMSPTKAAASLKIPPRKAPKDHLSLAKLIKERTAEIERRIAELDEREQTLAAVEVRINEKLAELEAARASLAETAARLDAASGEDIKSLAQMYANMKPAQAGQIFNAMEPTFAAGFLTQIRSESAAAILASMDPQKAYAVSVIIAGRNVEN